MFRHSTLMLTVIFPFRICRLSGGTSVLRLTLLDFLCQYVGALTEKYSYKSFANMEEDRLMFKILLLLKKKFHVLCTTNRRITFARVETD